MIDIISVTKCDVVYIPEGWVDIEFFRIGGIQGKQL